MISKSVKLNQQRTDICLVFAVYCPETSAPFERVFPRAVLLDRIGHYYSMILCWVMDLWVTVMCFAHRVLKLLERKIMAVISW